MFRTIVVPVDMTNRNRPAVDMAARLAAPSEGNVHLLHVIETIPGFSIEEEPDFYGRLEKKAAQHLEALSAPLREKGIRVECGVFYGPRAKTIIEEAAKLAAYLLV